MNFKILLLIILVYNYIFADSIIDNRSDINDIVQLRDNILSVLDDGNIRVWSIKEGKLLKKFFVDNQELITIALNKSKNMVAVGLDSGQIYIYTYKGHNESVNSVAISNNDRYIVSASDDGNLKIWNRAKKTLLYDLNLKDKIIAIDISKNSKYVAVALYVEDGNSTIKVVDIKRGKVLNTLYNNSDYPIKSIAIDKSGDTIAVTSKYKILIFNRNSQKAVKELIPKRNKEYQIIILNR